MNKLWAALTFLATLAFVLSYFLVPDFNGFEPSQFPRLIEEPPVQPAGYAFLIWGILYIWLLAAALFGLIKRADDEDWAPMRPMLTLSLAIGALWLPVAKYLPIVAVVMIFGMLWAALRAVHRVGDTDRWLQQGPVAVYAGWLTAASFVGLGVVLGGYNVMDPTIAALVCLSGALVVAVYTQYRLHRAPEYGITMIWALVAVIVQNSQPFNIAVAGLAVIGIVIILGLRGTDTE
jgi:hypothetical protein